MTASLYSRNYNTIEINCFDAKITDAANSVAVGAKTAGQSTSLRTLGRRYAGAVFSRQSHANVVVETHQSEQ